MKNDSHSKFLNLLFQFSFVFGFLGVALGAFGAHALKSQFGTYEMEIWNKAVFYLLTHTVVAITSGILYLQFGDRLLLVAMTTLLLGAFLFAGSLFCFALSKIRFFVVITPFGGLSMLLGWIFLLSSSLKGRSQKPD